MHSVSNYNLSFCIPISRRKETAHPTKMRRLFIMVSIYLLGSSVHGSFRTEEQLSDALSQGIGFRSVLLTMLLNPLNRCLLGLL